MISIPMQIAIIGIGALGCFYGARLHGKAGRLDLYGNWEEQLGALERGGLLLEEANGQTKRIPLSVRRYEEAQPIYDLVIVLVKSYQTQAAARLAKKLLNGASSPELVLTLQNGYGNLEEIEKEVGSRHALAGVTQQGAMLVQLGHVRDTGPGTVFLPQSSPSEVVGLFKEAGISVDQESDVDSLIWGKLAINAGINPLTAIHRVSNGDLPKIPGVLPQMVALATEVKAVAAAKGIQLSFDNIEQTLLKVCHDSSANHSSMLRDMESGRRTEVDAICGAVVREGQKVGVETPRNRQMLETIKALEPV